MTRSSTKELFTPFENPKREFRSSRKLFKTLSLDESSPPKFDLFSDLEEHSEEEEIEAMAKTMEEYMCKTRCQFLKELCDKHLHEVRHEDAIGNLEKLLDCDLFHISYYNSRPDNASSFPYVSHWSRKSLNKPSGSIKTWEDLKVKFLSNIGKDAKTIDELSSTLLNGDARGDLVLIHGLMFLTRQILDSKGAIPTKTAADAKKQSLKFRWIGCHPSTVNNLGREIKKVNEKVYAAQEGNTRQQLWDSTKEIMQILRIKSKDNQWKNQ
ncbi:hypothetical protein Tco_0086786 [Tanacetum coccineum]